MQPFKIISFWRVGPIKPCFIDDDKQISKVDKKKASICMTWENVMQNKVEIEGEIDTQS